MSNFFVIHGVLNDLQIAAVMFATPFLTSLSSFLVSVKKLARFTLK